MSRRTPIEDLIDLDDISGGFQPQSLDGHPPRINQNFQKQMHSEIAERDSQSGPMKNRVRQHSDMRHAMNGGMPYAEHTDYSDVFANVREDPYNVRDYHVRDNHVREDPGRDYQLGPRAAPKPELTCIQVANHIRTCPICSKFYDTDKSIYVVIIVILVVIAMILLKKVLENQK